MKSYWQMTDDEQAELKKLTPEEQVAVDNFIEAAKALPETLFIGLDDYEAEEEEEQNLTVKKRVAPGVGVLVSGLRKQSLSF